ncbi:MAG TPA: GGDEF domain-containing protein [Longimicrobium sp.]|jgi:diguanylate cyclase (GGDEF)-like protein
MPRTQLAKRQGLALATSGLLLALAVIAVLHGIHFTEVTAREWTALATVAVGLLGATWAILEHATFWRAWDPHFVLVPSVAVVVLLSLMISVAPETRTLVLGVWPVVLIFAAGYLGFVSAGFLSLLMTAGYLAATWASGMRGLRVEVEVLVGGVFLLTCLYSGVVLSRLRRQRNELGAARAELTRLALTDALTGLANRRHFDDVLAAELSRADRHQGVLSLAIIDLDHFKAFNDRYGHPAGDAALSAVGALLRARVRGHDTVARLGGEEFAVLMVGACGEAAWRTAERIRQSVTEHAFGAGGTHITVSIGLATAPGDGSTPAELVREADRALYRAKAAGRDTIAVAERDVAAAH